MNDAELIHAFAKDRAEAPFHSLVERHLPLVLGTARRITADPGLAEEVAQTVFILLSRKAGSLRQGTIISGWLYRTTCFVAARALRGEQRRRRREQEAVAMQNETQSLPAELAAHLDHSLQRLSRKERDAVLLRFFEQRPLSEVGASLGISEDAAKKRVTRALEKLRQFLSRPGTQITSGAIITTLAHESSKAAVSTAVISKVTVAALSPAAGSALLLDALSAWRWAKIKLLLGTGSGAVMTALIISHAISAAHDKQTAAHQTTNTVQNASAPSSSSPNSENVTPANAYQTYENGGQTLPAHPLQITVLDAVTGDPIAGAEVKNSMMWSADPQQEPAPLRTLTNGTVTFAVPNRIPGDDRMNQFTVFIHAKDYAPREINWLSSTGSVFTLVTNSYTVHVERGISISETVVDENGQPLEGVRVGASGNNYLGYTWSSDESGKVTSPPVLRNEDYSSFSRYSEKPDAVLTDEYGHFHFEHFPSDLKALVIDLIGSDGARAKFRTPQGSRMSSYEMPEISFNELTAGTARLLLPAGVTVQGVVVDTNGEPVIGAAVTEGTQWGNLRVLSTNYTDFAGRFWLSNRPPHEIILAASANGHGSASVITSVKKGMQPVRIQLPPEQPLRGQVVNESGTPVSGASIRLYDICNEGLGMNWDAKADSDGRFEWRDAPTNELTLMVSAPEAFKVVRLHATTNEQAITLLSGHNNNAAYITGTVGDATSGRPVDHFTVKLCHSHSGPPEIAQTTDGQNGAFSINTSQSEVAVGNYPVWYLLIEADGYDPLITREYDYNEGDQKLTLNLQPGGFVEGYVRSLQGEPVSECQLAVAALNEAVNSAQPGGLSLRNREDIRNKTGASGHFRLTKPLRATSLVAFHKTGWAIVPVPTNSQNLDVQLQPWGRIEGELMNGTTPIPRQTVGINCLMWEPGAPLQLHQNVQTDESGHFVFDKVPAGEYKIAEQDWSWQRMGQDIVDALQRSVNVVAGETNHIVLSDIGRTAIAKLSLPSNSQTSWTNCLAVLKRDVWLPSYPNRSNFALDSSYGAAQVAYAHDPAVLAATRNQRSYVGQITQDGSATFENVPPGNYLLEVKMFSIGKDTYDSVKIIAQTSASITIPAGADETNSPVLLGSFTLESL